MHVRSFAPTLVLAAALGCGGEDDASPQPTDGACLPPNRLVGDQCLEPGVQDNGCPAGTLGLDDGTCQPAGVPPELCAEGFVHDGDAACEPILPADPCPKGLMALPGETACRPVMDCGAGTWGDIPVDGETIYVDGSYLGGDSDGSQQKPWTTISAAVAAAPAGALVAVAAGSYVEGSTFAPARAGARCAVLPSRATVRAWASPVQWTSCSSSSGCTTRSCAV